MKAIFLLDWFHPRSNVLLGFAIAVGLVSNSAAFADGDIVFAAQHYRWSKELYRPKGGGAPEKKLDDVGPSHIYRINPDGTGLKQITFGSQNDEFPQWSRDGKKILFVRGKSGYETNKICLVSANCGAVKVIKTIDGTVNGRDCRLSPDGTRISYVIEKWQGGRNYAVIIDIATRQERRIDDVSDVTWSPDAKSVCLLNAFDEPERMRKSRILELATNRITELPVQVNNPTWITENTLLGDESESSEGNSDTIVRKVDRLGKVIWHQTVPVEFEAGYPRVHTWLQVPHHKGEYIVGLAHGMSDGFHYHCQSVNTQTAKVKELGDGMLLGVSPDGTRVAMADRDWVGPSKHGGRRCGPLRIVNLTTGKAVEITPKLMSIEGGDWRR